MRTISPYAFAIVVGCSAGCTSSGIQMTELPAHLDYVCANNRTLSVQRTSDQRIAQVRVEGSEVTLSRMPSAAQEKYGNNRYTLYLEGEVAMLEDLGTVIYGPCSSPVSLPTYYR